MKKILLIITIFAIGINSLYANQIKLKRDLFIAVKNNNLNFLSVYY